MEEESSKKRAKRQISEDWLAVILAFVLMALAAVGVLGENGIPVPW